MAQGLLDTPLGAAVQELWASKCTRLDVPVPTTPTLLAVLSIPHFLYAFIWIVPKYWNAWFGKQAADVLAYLGVFCKLAQFSAMATWAWSNRPTGLCMELSAIQLWQWLAFILLFAVGQSLNVAVYQALGRYGVYYGFKLGHKIPYVYGYPFNLVSHPQYMGSVMTIWAMGALLYNVMPAGWLAIGAYWTMLYIITSIQEDFIS